MLAGEKICTADDFIWEQTKTWSSMLFINDKKE